MTHSDRMIRAKEAIRAVASDTSVSRQQTEASLDELDDEIKANLMAPGETEADEEES